TDRAVISNSLGKLAVSSVTSTELGYLSGATSSVQTQINNRVIAGAFALGPNDASSTTYSLDSGSSSFPLGWPLPNEKFTVITTGGDQVAIQLSGTGAGDIYTRTRSGGSWGSWSLINDASA